MTAPAPFHSVDAAGDLAGARCAVCGTVVCPPRLMHCDRAMQPAPLRPLGRVEVWSTVHVAPGEHRTPYRIAYVRLLDGPRIVAKLAADCPADADGRPVRLIAETDQLSGQTVLVGQPARMAEEVGP